MYGSEASIQKRVPAREHRAGCLAYWISQTEEREVNSILRVTVAHRTVLMALYFTNRCRIVWDSILSSTQDSRSVTLAIG